MKNTVYPFMLIKQHYINRLCRILATILAVSGCSDSAGHDSKQLSREELGRALFFDTSLSNPPGKSCGSCHVPSAAFSDPGSAVSAGAIPGTFGKRSSPSLVYMAFSPEFHKDRVENIMVGGQFWDGRSVDLQAQVESPLLGRREMNNASKAEVVRKVQSGDSAALFREVYGNDIFSDIDRSFSAISDAIAAFEQTEIFSPFSSKYDLFLDHKVELTAQEARGLEIFNSPTKGNCAACHPSTPSDGHPPLFTDFTYDNLGVPKNRSNPFYRQPTWNNPEGLNFIDFGLAATTLDPLDKGKMKVPTLRNVTLTAPYFHNGVFNTLEEVVRFYSDRDKGGFDSPEVAQNVNRDELGNLGLSTEDVADLVAFLNTLTDGYEVE